MTENYKFHAKIGSGGFGEVFLTQDIRSNPLFKGALATKVINNCTDSVYKSYIKELNLIRKIECNKSFLLCAKDDYIEDNKCYIVMDYLGTDTHTLNLLKNRFKDLNLLKIMKNVTSALLYLHSKNIIHLDIKPSNIMVNTKTSNAWLIDYGISCLLTTNDDEDELSCSKIKTIIGTTKYLSPEICDIRKANNIDKWSDIYSLGLVFIYILNSGYEPFERFNLLTPEFLLSQRCNSDTNDKIMDDIDYLNSIGLKLKPFIRRMVHYDFRLRPTIEEVSATLKSL